MEDLILTGIGIAFPSLALILGFAKKAMFYYKAAKQAIEVFHEVKEANKDIYLRVQSDPGRKELAKIMAGGVKKIEGLSLE